METPALKDQYQFNVLVIDDDATILNLLKEIISLVPGCNVTTVSNPADGMIEVVKGNTDIVFTDVHLPGVTGLEMIKDITSLQQSPEIVVMTAYPSEEISQQAMELGAISLLAKPFEDITMVELELEKAVKRILRKRTVQKSNFKSTLPEMKVAIVESAEVAATEEDPASRRNKKTDQGIRKVYDSRVLSPLAEIEIERCKRYNRPFVLGYVDIPENFQLITQDDHTEYRKLQMERLENCVRRSDVLFDMGKEGAAIVGFECNKVGSEVMEHKLSSSGFAHSGFAVYPHDGKDVVSLTEAAKANLQNKRKLQVLLYEPEEFFGRMVQNMLSDPKYHVTWAKTAETTYQSVNRNTENIRLLILSLSKDPQQWELLVRFLKENLTRWPILLFIDIPLTKDLKQKLRQLGVRAVVHKGISQEEFIYIVQSFVVPRPAMDERKNFRALVPVPVVYRFNGQEVSSNTFTVSRDGLFIRDLNPPSSGSIIDVEIFVPGLLQSLKCRCEALYVVPYFVGVNRFHVAGLAVKFIDLSSEDREKLDKFVNDCLTSYLI
ncbi:MAG: response regulator [Deltaproteobacteria bacterium]|nr:response regulator [Deltaproteobacteria bacterium]